MLGGCLILGSCLALGGCLMLLGACSSSSLVSPRERSDFNADWRFHLGDGLQAAQPGLPTMTGVYWIAPRLGD